MAFFFKNYLLPKMPLLKDCYFFVARPPVISAVNKVLLGGVVTNGKCARWIFKSILCLPSYAVQKWAAKGGVIMERIHMREEMAWEHYMDALQREASKRAAEKRRNWSRISRLKRHGDSTYLMYQVK